MAEPIRARNVRPERVQWLWRERVPRGMMTIIGGRPDQGKGLVCSHIAAEVSNMPRRDKDGKIKKGRNGKRSYCQVLYSAIEDSHGLMTRPRLEASGANLDNVHLWRFMMGHPGWIEELTAHLVEQEIDLLVIDPLAAHLSHGVSRHSDNIRQVLNPLTAVIEKTGTAVIVVEHMLKRVPQSGHPLQAIGGSGSGIVAASRMAFLFGVDPSDEDRRVLCSVKANIRERPKALAFEMDSTDIGEIGDVPYLLYEDEITFDAQRLLTFTHGGKVGRPPDKRAAACEWLTNYLYNAGEPVKAGKVFEDAKHYGMSSRTLKRAKHDMEIVTNPPGGGRNSTWELPDGIKEVLDDANKPPTPQADDGPKDADGPVDGEPLISDDDIQAFLDGGKGGSDG